MNIKEEISTFMINIKKDETSFCEHILKYVGITYMSIVKI